MNLSHLVHVAFFTFTEAACSTFIALLIGFAAAFFCGRRRFFFRRALLSLSSVPFCVPALIVALGYVTFLGINGGLNHFLMYVFKSQTPPVKILYSFAGLILAQGFYNFPIVMKTVSDSWEKLPSEQAESARLLGAGEGRIFRTVTVYQLIPAISSSCLLVFIYCFLSFILVLLFGGIGNTTLEVEIYKSARATLDFSKTTVLAMFETSILCVVTALYAFFEEKSSRIKGLSEEKLFNRKKITGATEVSLFVVLILLILIFFLAPLAGIIINAFTSTKTNGFSFSTFAYVLKMKSFLPSVKSAVFVATCTGSICSLLGFLYASVLRLYETRTGKKLKLVLKILPMIPMCVSGVVAGVVIVAFLRRGTVLSLILVQSALMWPLAFRQIQPLMTKISSETLDSASLLSKSKIDVMSRILFPVTKRGILSGFGFCFASSAGDTTLPLVLAIPKFETLSLFTYRLAGAYRFNEACASGIILAAICILFFAGSCCIRRK